MQVTTQKDGGNVIRHVQEIKVDKESINRDTVIKERDNAKDEVEKQFARLWPLVDLFRPKMML